MRKAMSRNAPEDQAPGQPGGPSHAIMARLDLDPMGEPHPERRHRRQGPPYPYRA